MRFAILLMFVVAAFAAEQREVDELYEVDEPVKPLFEQQQDLFEELVEATQPGTITSPLQAEVNGVPTVPHRPVPGLIPPAAATGAETPVSSTEITTNGAATLSVPTTAATVEANPFELPSPLPAPGAKAVLGVHEYAPTMRGESGKTSPSIPLIKGSQAGYVATRNSYKTAATSAAGRAETSVEITEGEQAAAQAARIQGNEDQMKSMQAAVAEAQDDAAIAGKKYKKAYDIDAEAQKQVRIAKAAAEEQHQRVIAAKKMLLKQEKILRFDDKVVHKKEKEELQARIAGQAAGAEYKAKQERAMRKYKALNAKVHHIAEMKRFQKVATAAVRKEEANQAAAAAASASKTMHANDVKKAATKVKHAATKSAKKEAKKLKHKAKKQTCKTYAAEGKNCPDKFLPHKDKTNGGSTKFCGLWAKQGYCKPITKGTHAKNAKARFMGLYCAGSCKGKK